MSLKIPKKFDFSKPPRWAVENYSSAEEDMEEWLTSFYFYQEWDGKEDTLKEASDQARAVAQAKLKTLDQTNSLKEVANRSIIIQLYNAKKTGWYTHINEIGDLKELLNYILEKGKEKNSSSIYNMEFIISTLLPTLEQIGAPTEMVTKISDNLSKAEWSVPTFRKIIQNNGPQMEQNVMRLMEAVVDKSIPATTLRDEIIPEIMGTESPKTAPSITASVCMIPDGRELIIIPSDPAHTRAIRMSTKSIVNGFGYTDPVYLLREFGDLIKPKANQKKKYKSNTFGELVVSTKEGVYLTDPSSYREIVIQKYFDHRFYIRKPGTHTLLLEEVGFSFTPDLLTKSLGYMNDDDAYVAMEKLYAPAVEGFEKNIPSEDHIKYELRVGQIESTPGHIGVFSFLTIEFQGL